MQCHGFKCADKDESAQIARVGPLVRFSSRLFGGLDGRKVAAEAPEPAANWPQAYGLMNLQ
jgi:hypothetical protein